jgi:hypothetical protein
MGLQTILGPLLVGTQKNNNPTLVTAATPTAAMFTGSGAVGPFRNTGPGDAFQFIN